MKIWEKISMTLAKPINKLNDKMEAFLEYYDPQPKPIPKTKWEKLKEKLNSFNIFKKNKRK